MMTLEDFRFGTVGSPLSTPKKPGGSVGGVLRSAEMGLYALELGWVRSVRVSEKTCALIKRHAEEQDVLISVHAPYFMNLNATEEEWRGDLGEIAAILTESCRQIDPTSTEKALEQVETTDDAADNGND